ncbi:MAG: HAD family hydrolase [Myxococcales bacterium]
MAIAFFDLDNTLLARNSGALWINAELRAGHITPVQALRAWSWLARYALGFARLEDAILASIATLNGQEERVLRERTAAFYEREVRRLFRPHGRNVLARHRADGEQLVLLTSSSNYLSEPVANELTLDGYLCNRFEVDASGRYTGRALGPLCFGPGKVEVAKAFADARGVDLKACAFYTDSASDLPMLEAVGRPVAVNPDPRLRRIARQRGWAVEDWGVPG